jgi:hypothetical protein
VHIHADFLVKVAAEYNLMFILELRREEFVEGDAELPTWVLVADAVSF